MKLITIALVTLLGLSPMAQAQVYFDSASARPNNPGAARQAVDRSAKNPGYRQVRSKLVRCRDGARKTARACRHHGGVARR